MIGVLMQAQGEMEIRANFAANWPKQIALTLWEGRLEVAHADANTVCFKPLFW